MRCDSAAVSFVAACLGCALLVSPFTLPASSFLVHNRRRSSPNDRHARSTALASGYGIATNYTWKEEAYELEVTVPVPANTRAKEIVFKATSNSIDLRLKAGDGPDIVLLDAGRTLRGRVSVDGTYWVISDSEVGLGNREVTVTIEKRIKTPRDDFEIVDYDWKGVYSTEDADEVKDRKYDTAEPLDVREYAGNMGVDIDNINVSLVDKTMFTSGLNLTQNTLDELNQAGYLTQEVTRQADGTEYAVNDDGEAVPISAAGAAKGRRTPAVPLLDTDSPWHTVTADAEVVPNETVVRQQRNFTRAAFADDSAKGPADKTNPFAGKAASLSQDPIDALTVARLKEILKAQGLKTSGLKSELQDRLRSQVNNLLQGKQQDK